MQGVKVLTRLCVLDVHMKQSSRAIRLIYCSSLHILPYFVCARSDGSDETVRTRCTYEAIKQGYTSDILFEPSYTTILCMCEE